MLQDTFKNGNWKRRVRSGDEVTRGDDSKKPGSSRDFEVVEASGLFGPDLAPRTVRNPRAQDLPRADTLVPELRIVYGHIRADSLRGLATGFTAKRHGTPIHDVVGDAVLLKPLAPHDEKVTDRNLPRSLHSQSFFLVVWRQGS
jgi:hypothetical protein